MLLTIIDTIVDTIVANLGTIAANLISFLALLIAFLTYKASQGDSLSHSFTPRKLLPEMANHLTICITNNKNKTTEVKELFIDISNISLKLPTPPFSLAPHASTTIKLNLSSIYAIEPEIDPSATPDYFNLAPPTIKIRPINTSASLYSSEAIESIMKKIRIGSFLLTANTNKKRIKIKYKKTETRREKEAFSVITIDQAKENLLATIESQTLVRYTEEDIKSVSLADLNEFYEKNEFNLLQQNGKYILQMKKDG